MAALLKLSRAIDYVNDRFGEVANWLVLFACLISAGNATSRYLFSASSNAWLEVQWYMFAGMVLLGGPYTLKVNEHVRVDLLYSALSERARIWIDIIGFIGIELCLIRPDFLGNLTYQLFGIVSNDLLLAIPFFTFMGAILERCGLAEDLLDSIGQLFGPVRGGLSYAVIFVGAILGAITGTVAASVIAMGVIAMTPMLKYG